MRKLLIVAVLFMIALGVIGVGWFLPRLPFTGPWRGRVVDATTGQPIPGVTIAAEWWCHDNPLPDGPGHYTIRAAANSDIDGQFTLTPPVRRGGWFGTHFALVVRAREYIDAVFIVDPNNTPLPPSTATWPFVDTTIHTSLPATMTIELQPAKPVLLKALESSDPLIRQTAEEELQELEGN